MIYPLVLCIFLLAAFNDLFCDRIARFDIFFSGEFLILAILISASNLLKCHFWHSIGMLNCAIQK